jgi:hypothetical protein
MGLTSTEPDLGTRDTYQGDLINSADECSQM